MPLENKQGFVNAECRRCGHVQLATKAELRKACFCDRCGEKLYMARKPIFKYDVQR